MRRLAIIFAAALLASLALAADEQAPVRRVGKVKSISIERRPSGEEGARIQVGERGGTLYVSAANPHIFRLARKKLVSVSTDKTGQRGPEGLVLGKLQPAAQTSQGKTQDPQIVSVQVIVVGSLPAPDLTPEQLDRKLEWFKGPILNLHDKRFLVNGVNMQAGPDRPVLVVEDARLEDIVKGETLFVSGERVGSGREVRVRASRLGLVPPTIPLEELKVVLGL